MYVRRQNIHEIISDAQFKAAARFHLPVELLNAIKQVESNGYPWALCVNLGNGKSITEIDLKPMKL